jgi:hypothetical protein
VSNGGITFETDHTITYWSLLTVFFALLIIYTIQCKH